MPVGREPLILSINTATPEESVALTCGGRVTALRIDPARLASSATLLANIDRLLHSADTRLSEVELFAVATGPGSFTGLRTGLATVKAFAVTLRRLCVGVPTLSAIGRAGGPTFRTVALLPAGRGEVFAQLLSVRRDGGVEELGGPWHVRLEILVEQLGARFSSLKWVGATPAHSQIIREYADRYGTAFSDTNELEGISAKSGWRVSEPLTPAALVEEIAALAGAASLAGQATSAENLRAIYVRPSDAELKERCREPHGLP